MVVPKCFDINSSDDTITTTEAWKETEPLSPLRTSEHHTPSPLRIVIPSKLKQPEELLLHGTHDMSSSIQQQRSRPGPSTRGGGGGGQQLLNALYQCIDNRNFSKVIKLTSLDSNSSSSSNSNDEKNWDIVRALRAHSLERVGRRREALLLLWDLLVASTAAATIMDTTGEGQQQQQQQQWWWRELKSKIEHLSSPVDVVISSTLSAAATAASSTTSTTTADNSVGFTMFDPIVALDRRAYTPIPLPYSAATTTTTATAATSYTTTKSSTSKVVATKMMMMIAALPPITDALVLKTITVVLKNEGLYATISTMYHTSIEYLLSTKSTTTSSRREEEDENYISIFN